MGSIVKWAKFGSWSGPYIKGTVPYVLPANPTGFDIIVAAIAKPEGGDYDTFVAYDGTAVTYGLLQWTFTSGRLHKLLYATMNAMPAGSYFDLLGHPLQELTGLNVDSTNGVLYLGDNKKVIDFFSLRDVCTPPNGQCPKVGKNWEKAKAIALLFSKLGENPIAQKVQIDFFREELRKEITFKRPMMGGATIGTYLYPDGWDDDTNMVNPSVAAARALFWGMWQNSPRKAEQLLDTAARGFFIPLENLDHLRRLAKLFANTSFGRWGVGKAKKAEKPYTSRYQKVAEAINKAMQQIIVPELWK